MWNKNKISILRIICQTIYLALFIAAVVSKNIILIMAITSTVLLGPIFCGWLCFFGFYQDILRYIGKLIKKDPLEMDEKIHQYLRYSRYLVLLAATTLGGIFLLPDEIKHSFSSILKGHLQINIALYALLVLGFLSLFTKRFYCKYLCTFGAKLGLFSFLRSITIKRSTNKCINCMTCNKECSMQINICSSNNLANPSCINCFKCVEKCPKDALYLGLRNYLKP